MTARTPRKLRPARRTISTLLILGCVVITGFAEPGIHGLPFSRPYSLEDVGYVPRGARLNLDPFGRIAVIHDGVYAVLNDTAWLNIADPEESARTPMTDVLHAGYGQTFYGGRASWGIAEFGIDGKIHAKSLVPKNAPAWTRTTTFEELIGTADGIYFVSRNGVVFWDFIRKECQLFELERISRVFAVGSKVFVSSSGQALRTINLNERRVEPVPVTALDRVAVDHAIVLDGTRSLVSLMNGRLFVFDGLNLTPWSGGQGVEETMGRISVLQRLADGRVAVAVTGKGVFVYSPEGTLLTSLTTPQYHQISSIASREPGVLWLLTEESIEKVLYSGGLTSFGQRLGLTLGWPQVAARAGRTFVTSGGVLYEAVPDKTGGPARFERFKNQPAGGAMSLTSGGSHLITGSRAGIFSVQSDDSLQLIGQVKDLNILMMVGDNLCYAIGTSEIALFEWDGSRWFEPVARVPGLPHSFNVQRTAKAVWVEMGGDGVARVSRKDGEIKVTVIKNEPWTKALWVNIGVVGDVAVLSTLRDQRRFFDDRSESWCDMPGFAKLLDRSPHWIARVWMDDAGTLWATHTEGLVRFTPKGDDYEMDLSTYDLINDRYPIIYILPGSGTWVSASRSLHHVEQVENPRASPASKPVLVSLMDTRRNVELLTHRLAPENRLQLPFAQNSLTFRFFSGSYARRRAPVYEVRMKPSEPWVTLDTGSLLRLSALREGAYDLEVKIAGEPVEPGGAMRFSFDILPPWQRTLPAYLLYGSILVVGVIGISRLSVGLAHRRNRALEEVVRARTSELKSTMEKLNEETRITATLAERDRLAGEIHDSVQQGLSGAIIQLDTTLRLPSLDQPVLTRLQVVRNMLSYARQEVQHAVWDLDSPLLEGNDLGEALRKLTTFTLSNALVPVVSVSGTPIQLPRVTTHHLLRIAQEATTNSLRHAQAQHIDIALEYQAGAVTLTISDDGIGFPPDDGLNKAGHFGLRGIRGRAKKLGAEITVTSSMGRGTTVRVIAPVVSPT